SAGMLLMRIKTKFVVDVNRDEHAAGKPDGQAKNVDEGEYFVSEQAAECKLKVSADHKQEFVFDHQCTKIYVNNGLGGLKKLAQPGFWE
ncbi:MAG TPA: hypothetical protein VD996_15250, partial [Chitinophagaceae bacterium]|nr:hypothetical protein [Chitinophagaceae bacterium]